MSISVNETKERYERYEVIWLTSSELGLYYGKDAKEIKCYLEKLGLCDLDSQEDRYQPSLQAKEQELYTTKHSRRKKLLYLWNKSRVSKILLEQMGLKELDEVDIKARNFGLQLLQYCKNYPDAYKKKFDPLRDIFLAPEMPLIMAWYLIEEEKKEEKFEPNANHLLRLIDSSNFHMINYELARLGSKILLGEYDYETGIHVGNVPEFADCDMCREMCEIEAMCT